MPPNPWTATEDARLEILWNEGHSTNKIASMMPGRTKNAIVGRSHRLELPARPSPINFSGEKRPHQIKRAGLQTLPALKSLEIQTKQAHPVAQPTKLKHPDRAKLGARATHAIPVQVVAPPEPNPPRLSKSPCCWPFGDPGKPGFRFCGDASRLGKPYCPTHCAVAYRPYDGGDLAPWLSNRRGMGGAGEGFI